MKNKEKILTLSKPHLKHLLEIINDILDLSKIEAGRVSLENQEFMVRETIKEVITSLTPAAQRKYLSINMIVNDNVPNKIYCDKLRLKQILYKPYWK